MHNQKRPDTLEAPLELLEASHRYWSVKSCKTRRHFHGQWDSLSNNPDVTSPQRKGSANIRFHVTDSGPGDALQPWTLFKQKQLTPKPQSLQAKQNDTVLLISLCLEHIQLDVNAQNLRVLVDRGASISILKRSRGKAEDIFKGRAILIRGYDGDEKDHCEWMSLTVKYHSQYAQVLALVIEVVKYDFSFSSGH